MWETKEWARGIHHMIKAPLLVFLPLSMPHIEPDSLLPQRWLKVLFSTKNKKRKVLQSISKIFILNINEKNNKSEIFLIF